MLAADSANEAFDRTNTEAHKLKGQSEKDHQQLIAFGSNRTHIVTNPSDSSGNDSRDSGNHISHVYITLLSPTDGRKGFIKTGVAVFNELFYLPAQPQKEE